MIGQELELQTSQLADLLNQHKVLADTPRKTNIFGFLGMNDEMYNADLTNQMMMIRDKIIQLKYQIDLTRKCYIIDLMADGEREDEMVLALNAIHEPVIPAPIIVPEPPKAAPTRPKNIRASRR